MSFSLVVIFIQMSYIVIFFSVILFCDVIIVIFVIICVYFSLLITLLYKFFQFLQAAPLSISCSAIFTPASMETALPAI